MVKDALEQLTQNRTSLIIAHRLSTVERAERILVLEQGQIVETGSHAELLAKGGVYADLYRLQFKEDSGA
jgi:ABC-type multidrug transport system fused ATPase/permease subunit